MLKEVTSGLTERGVDIKWLLVDSDVAEKALQRLGGLLDEAENDRAVILDIAAYGKLIEYHFEQIKKYLADLDSSICDNEV
jgi:hypothetical protein